MKTIRTILTLLFTFLLVMPAQASLMTSFPAQDQQVTAIMRGYRTGYSDGYQAGVADAAANSPKEYRNKAEYNRADRAYNAGWGALEEYRDGYRQGFEIGYGAGYERKPFDSTIPTDLKRRTEDNTVQYPVDQNKAPGNPVDQNKASGNPVDQNKTVSNGGTADDAASTPGATTIPRDTIMRVELLTGVSTDISQQGDPFQARVLEPRELNGAILDGHIAQLQRPGKAKGTAQLQLAFDQIRFANGQTAKFNAQVIEVIANGSSQGVGKVDSEGGVQGQDSTKSDIKKVGGAAGIGAVIGLIFGGGPGAAVGAGIGAGVGTAGVLTQRGKDIELPQGQLLRIRTNADVAAQ